VGGLFSTSTNLGRGEIVSAGARDAFVVHFDESGIPVWSRVFGSTGGDEITGIAADATGRVYVCGRFEGTVDFDAAALTSAGGSDGFVASFEPDGTARWAVRTSGPAADHLGHIAHAPGGVLVSGGGFFESFSAGGIDVVSAGREDGILVAHDDAGNVLWATALGGTGSDSIRDVATGLDGAVYAIGIYNETADFGTGPRTADAADFFVVAVVGTGHEDAPA
jgi:hypothetical protein